MPNVAAGRKGKRAILHGDMNTGLERGINIVDAVGGQEEDAFVVFEHAEEDYIIISIIT